MTITTLNKKAIAVTGLPEGATLLAVNGTGNCLSYSLNGIPQFIDLPEGNWTILSFSKDLTEEDWKQVVPCETLNDDVLGIVKWYDDFSQDNPKDSCLTSAMPSGHSLLKSKGLHVTNPLMSEKPITVIGHKGQEKICELILKKFQDQWQSAELLTNPLILIRE